jgi:hypothetical protein
LLNPQEAEVENSWHSNARKTGRGRNEQPQNNCHASREGSWFINDPTSWFLVEQFCHVFFIVSQKVPNTTEPW